MWDKINKQFYANSGTGAFVAGIKTLNDARMLDKALPAVPDGSTYSITLSLPVEASTDAPAQKALNDLAARGWSINIQYREEEIPAGYAKVSFLESSGTQNICVQAPNLFETAETWNVETDCQFLSGDEARIGFINRGGLMWGMYNGNIGTASGFAVLDVSATDRNIATWTTKYRFTNKDGSTSWALSIEALGQRKTYNGGNGKLPSTWEYGEFKLVKESNASISMPLRIWSCKCWCNSVNYDLIPVINTDGEPGMWDRVNKQFYANAGTGQFRVGLASKEAVRNLYLTPDVQEGTTINLSVPAGTTEEDTDILKANNPNYTFNIQYRS